MTRGVSGWGGAVALVLLGLGAGTAGATAQEPSPDPQARADSTRLRVMERLRRLGRPPGYDSILYVQDSIARDSASQRRPRGGGGARDSTLTALLGMPGFALTEYQGGRADFGAAERVLVLQAQEGSRAVVNREGMEVQADSSIVYSEATGRVRTVGPSTFSPARGDPVESGGLIYDLTTERGSAYGARTSYNQGGARWHVGGDMPFASPDSTFMSRATFTSCDLEVPHYHFATDEIKIVGDNVLIARPVRLYFADVPVAWLPFIAQSLSQGRSSGLLTPRFSVNDIVRTSGGYRRRVSNVGFYWAMSDYSDAIVAFDWFSENFFSVTASTSYRWNRRFLDGAVNFRRYWQDAGGTQLALDTRHSWEMDERTQLRISGRYASSSDFVRDNSFNPREVTQSIDSEGGLNRRFDWGNVSLGANRQQYLSDDRVVMTLPSASVSLSPITLFRAPQNRAGFWNNLTWSGGTNFRRTTTDRAQGEVYDPSLTDDATTTGSVRSNLSIGNLTFSQSVEVTERGKLGVPEAYLVLGEGADTADLLTGAPARDIADTDLRWSASVNYQQKLIGSTTLTPSLSVSGSRFKSDTSQVASTFVAAPSRVNLGATLKTDIYGFFPGFGGFEMIRHKVSPAFTYDWSPEVQPTDLQRQVFRSRVLQPQNALSISLNQTFEAKREQPDSAEADSAAVLLEDEPGQPGEPRRVQRAEIVSLLALRTSVVRYDFVEADSAGSFLAGFQTTRLSNQISSDFLRGLSISVDHDLFEDTRAEDGALDRKFAPHLSQVNLSFALSNRSSIFRWLGFGGPQGEEPEEEEEDDEDDLFGEDDPFQEAGPTDESSIVPSGRRAPQAAARRGSLGGWNASLSYSLQRPRDETRAGNQMLNGTLTMRPTENWDLSWRTAYDLEEGRFNDHTIRLSRDLHRWKANFDFLQTATGNWTFRFEVSLIDNQDLKFDYEQRNLDVGFPPSRRR